jgi:predicted CXXCH cytochrome family protein
MIVGCLGILAAAATLIASDSDLGPHRSMGNCAECHLSGEKVPPEQASQLIATQEVLCGRCHKGALRLGHPTGFMPSHALPAEYPTDWKGELTCSTCHEPHGLEPGLLRGARRAREFCLSCHDMGFFTGMKDDGTSIVTSGHLGAGRGLRRLDVDAYSLHCLGCHAGGDAAMGGAVTVRAGVVQHSSGSAPHPIGRIYRDAARKGAFHPPEKVDQEHILLPDGKVSCVSCHEAYKAEHGKLVMSNHRSALCLSCHNM